MNEWNLHPSPRGRTNLHPKFHRKKWWGWKPWTLFQPLGWGFAFFFFDPPENFAQRKEGWMLSFFVENPIFCISKHPVASSLSGHNLEDFARNIVGWPAIPAWSVTTGNTTWDQVGAEGIDGDRKNESFNGFLNSTVFCVFLPVVVVERGTNANSCLLYLPDYWRDINLKLQIMCGRLANSFECGFLWVCFQYFRWFLRNPKMDQHSNCFLGCGKYPES